MVSDCCDCSSVSSSVGSSSRHHDSVVAENSNTVVGDLVGVLVAVVRIVVRILEGRLLKVSIRRLLVISIGRFLVVVERLFIPAELSSAPLASPLAHGFNVVILGLTCSASGNNPSICSIKSPVGGLLYANGGVASIIASIVSAEDTLKLIQTTRLQPRHSAQTLSDGYGKLNLGLMQGPTTSTSSSPSSPPSPRTHITAVHLVNQVATDRRFYLSGAGLGLAMGLYSKLFVYRIRILFDLLNRSTISIIYLYSLFKTYTYTEYFVNIY